jgi:flagellar biosynthetic protein FlhB
VVVWVAYSFLRARVPELLGLNQTDFLAALKEWATLALSLALRVGGAYLVVAFTDYGYQRWQYLRSLRMSKQEIKEEIKQQEGDPVIRGRIRSQQRRMTRHRMMANVPKADVVITNPTHLAIAIQYEADEMKAPKVLAKGAHHTAERIVALARQHGIPVIQDIPVARALYRHVEIDQEIPAALYAAVAQILAYVFRLQGRMGGAQAEAR